MICPGLAAPLAFAGGAQGGIVRYAVRPGDTIDAIAKRGFDPVCGSGAVLRLNRLSQGVKLAPGQTLLIPRLLLREEKIQGTLEGFSGPVVIRPTGRAGAPARVGDTVGEGAVIETGADASARVALQDGSRIALPSNSRVRIDRLRLVVLTGALDRTLSLLAGRAESTVTPMTDSTGRYVVSTPVAVSAVRGTVFRSAYDVSAREGSFGVLKGAVAVAGGGREVTAHADQGVTADPTGVSDPKPLPAAPRLDHADGRQVGETAAFEIRPAAGIVRHHIRIASDASLTQTVREIEQAEAHVSLADLPDGAFFASVTDIAAGGLEGLPTTFTFAHQRHELIGLKVREEQGLGQSRYTFTWTPLKGVAVTYRFTLARADAPARAAPVIDRRGLAETETQATDIPPGAYVWQVSASWPDGGKTAELASEPQPLTVDAPGR